MDQPRLSERQISTVYKGRFFSIEQHRWEIDGRSVMREVLRHPGAVLIVPLLADGRIVFIRNYRLATDSWLLELPAGTCEPHESPEATARRELEEESGYTAATIRPLGAFYTSPGVTDERMHVFLAESLIAAEQRLEPWEQIEIEPMTPAEAQAMVISGELVDGKSIVALHLLEQYLREESPPASRGSHTRHP